MQQVSYLDAAVGIDKVEVMPCILARTFLTCDACEDPGSLRPVFWLLDLWVRVPAVLAMARGKESSERLYRRRRTMTAAKPEMAS